MNFRILVTLTSLLVLAACGSPSELQNYSAHNDVTGDSTPSKWSESAFPIQLQIAGDFDESEQDAISEMSSQWASSSKSSTNYFNPIIDQNPSPNKSNLDAYNDNVMGVYKVTNWDPELPATALAVTQLFGSHKGSKIVIEHADILVNYENFEFTSDGGYGYDLRTVVLHELGHFLGLYHEFETPDESIMYPSISRFDIRREPMQFDVQNIQNKYNFSYTAANHNNFINSPEESSDNYPVVIRLELNARGKCTHRINGKVVHEH